LPDVARIPRIQSSRDSSSRAWIRTACPRALATLIPTQVAGWIGRPPRAVSRSPRRRAA
jgi:hypothetical protein